MRGNKPTLFSRWLGALLVGLLLAPVGGCGTAIYLSKIGSAKESLEEARELGAEEKTPYEYYSAQARLEEAKHEAAHAEYGDAIRLATESQSYSRQALQKLLDGERAAPPGAEAGPNTHSDEVPPSGQRAPDADRKPASSAPVVAPSPDEAHNAPGGFQPPTGDDT